MNDVEDVHQGPGHYVLGHTNRELERLARQAAVVDPITRRFLRGAGIGAGMRILDIGCGVGHVSFLAAELVGKRGEVTGVDRASEAVNAATIAARERSLHNVSFREGDPDGMIFEQPFDAVIGRYVLQFQPEPAALLRQVAAHVRPGGLVVFHELDWGGIWSFPVAPTFDGCCEWAIETLRLSGVETRMGMKLHRAFVAAGLPDPWLRMEAPFTGGHQSSVALRQMVDLIETLAPAMERLGVATAEEIGHESLFDRLIEETTSRGSVIVSRLQVGCWSRVSGSSTSSGRRAHL